MASPLELIRQGTENNDMEMVRQGYAALTGETVVQKPTRAIHNDDPPPMTVSVIEKPLKGRKPKSAKKDKKLTEQTKTFANDAEYFRWLSEQENKRREDTIAGKASSPIGNKLISADYEGQFAEEKAIEGYGKVKDKVKPPTTRRDPVRYQKVKCPRCQKEVEISTTDYHSYNWNLENQDSQLPTYSCGCG